MSSGGPSVAKDVEAYQRDWALKTGRRPEDIYVPSALRAKVQQALKDAIDEAEQVEVDGQLSLFEQDWHQNLDEPVEIEPPVPPAPPVVDGVEPPHFETAFMVVLKQDGRVDIITDIEQRIHVDRLAQPYDVARSLREAHAELTRTEIASTVARMLTPPPAPPSVQERLREKAKADGLID